MANRNDPLGMLLIGAGRIGELHARNIVYRLPALTLDGIVDPYAGEDFAAWAALVGVPLFDDIAAALAVIKPRAALIATPTDLHETAAVSAIEAGLHVFCEKPVAPDIPAAARIIRTARSAGVMLQIGFNRRFDHNFAALRETVKKGRIGEVEMLRVTSRDPGPPSIGYIKRSGGLFMDMTIHDFDMARFLSGDEITQVYARGTSLVDPEIGRAGDIDTAVVTFDLAGGAIGFIENSRRAAYGYDQRAEVLGGAGAAATANDTPSSLAISDGTGVHKEKPLYFFLERYEQSFIAELESFADAVAKGAEVAVSGEDGLQAMRIAEACRVSLLEGRPVKLEEVPQE